jgi:hypothetical protein
LITGRLIALIDRKGKKGRRGGGRARRESRGGAGSVGAAGGRRKEGGEGRLTGGPRLSAPRGKKKKGRGRGGLAREVGWAAWAEREPVRVFFFFFLFPNSIFKPNSFQIQIKSFKLFPKNFIDFLETSQATKNHASQLMMHIHLLSLSYLNYI